MNKLQLYKLLRKNINLSYKRSPAFEQNRWAKVLIGFGGVMFVLYLILYGILIGMAADGEAGTLITTMIIILPIDFLLRFIFQTTPAMMVKPYILLPISRYSAIECFLISSHLSGFNFLWLGLFIPFAIIVLFYTYIQYSLVAPTIGIVSIVRSIYGKPPFTIQVCLRGNLQAERETTEEGIAVCILQSIWYHW